jgi:hypothetical protein
VVQLFLCTSRASRSSSVQLPQLCQLWANLVSTALRSSSSRAVVVMTSTHAVNVGTNSANGACCLVGLQVTISTTSPGSRAFQLATLKPTWQPSAAGIHGLLSAGCAPSLAA